MTKNALVLLIAALAVILAVACGGSPSAPSAGSSGGGAPAATATLVFTGFTATVNRRDATMVSVMVDATVNGPAGTPAGLEVTGLGKGCSLPDRPLTTGGPTRISCNVWVAPGEYTVTAKVPGATPETLPGYVSAR